MAGQYHSNIKEAIIKLQQWHDSVMETPNSWEGNYLYIDEINGFLGIPRKDWLKKSIEVYNLLTEQFVPNKNNILFLRIVLNSMDRSIAIDKISADWLDENLNEFTPPNFHYTSLDYFKGYYEQELEKCNLSDDLKSLLTTNNAFYYYNKYDESEGEYLRDVYIFNLRGAAH